MSNSDRLPERLKDTINYCNGIHYIWRLYTRWTPHIFNFLNLNSFLSVTDLGNSDRLPESIKDTINYCNGIILHMKII